MLNPDPALEISSEVERKLKAARESRDLDPFFPHSFELFVIRQEDRIPWESLGSRVAFDDHTLEYLYEVPDKNAAMRLVELVDPNELALMQAFLTELFDKTENIDLAERLCLKIRSSDPKGKWLSFFFPAAEISPA